MTDFTKLKEGLPAGPWSACKDGECKCGFIWSADGNTHLASAHGPDSLGQDWFGSDVAPNAEMQQTLARAIAAIPEMLAEIAQASEVAERNRKHFQDAISENDRLRAENDLLTRERNTATNDCLELSAEIDRLRKESDVLKEENAGLDERVASLQIAEPAFDELMGRFIKVEDERDHLRSTLKGLADSWDELKAERDSLSSLLLTARESEKALASAVAKREEEAMALTRVAEGFRKALRKTCEALEWAGHDDDDPSCPPCAAYAQARAVLGEKETQS